MSNLKFLSFSLKLFPFVLSLSTHVKSHSPHALQPPLLHSPVLDSLPLPAGTLFDCVMAILWSIPACPAAFQVCTQACRLMCSQCGLRHPPASPCAAPLCPAPSCPLCPQLLSDTRQGRQPTPQQPEDLRGSAGAAPAPADQADHRPLAEAAAVCATSGLACPIAASSSSPMSAGPPWGCCPGLVLRPTPAALLAFEVPHRTDASPVQTGDQMHITARGGFSPLRSWTCLSPVPHGPHRWTPNLSCTSRCPSASSKDPERACLWQDWLCMPGTGTSTLPQMCSACGCYFPLPVRYFFSFFPQFSTQSIEELISQ